jgi:hypothetical protein
LFLLAFLPACPLLICAAITAAITAEAMMVLAMVMVTLSTVVVLRALVIGMPTIFCLCFMFSTTCWLHDSFHLLLLLLWSITCHQLLLVLLV